MKIPLLTPVLNLIYHKLSKSKLWSILPVNLKNLSSHGSLFTVILNKIPHFAAFLNKSDHIPTRYSFTSIKKHPF